MFYFLIYWYAVIVAIDDNVEIDYGLVAAPSYASASFLETVHKVG